MDSPPAGTRFEGEATLVDTPAAWQLAEAALRRAKRLAVDLEADGFHRYPEHLSLFQIALQDGTIFLLDPLAIPNLDTFGQLMADTCVQKVFHSADYDLRSLDRDFHFTVRGLYDTSIAAQFCGATRTGLGNVLAEFLEVVLDKPKRLQRLDWSQRPLPPDAMAYAAGDVAYLFDLADHLARQAGELGRTDWIAEECRRLELVHFVPPHPPELAFLSMRGARELSAEGRAVLKELFLFRDDEAIRRGRPPFHILSNEALIQLAAQPNANLSTMPGLGRWAQTSGRRRLQQALARGLAAPPIAWPPSAGRNPWTLESRERLAVLKAWRTREADQLGLEAGVVWPLAHLEQVALSAVHQELRAFERKEPLPWVRNWQWQVLGDSLSRCYGEMMKRPEPTSGDQASGSDQG